MLTIMPTANATNATLDLASELRVALMRLVRRLRAERPDEGLTLSQLAVLGSLERHGPMKLGELAAHERVQPPSMTRAVAHLEERALVVRAGDPADRRHVVVSISELGKRLLREDRRRREQWLAGRLNELTVAERELLASVTPLLERLARW
jgi:DNA-binding MarR family transcriptional regulator